MVWSFKKSDALPESQFVLWGDLLERRTGIQLAQPQHILLQTQVSIRMRELGIDNYQQYFNVVKDDVAGIAEWQVLLDRLVVKETHFFRHRPSLNLVKQYLEKKLSTAPLNSETGKPKESFEIWSVGCSTGEEPYSLAAIAADCFKAANIPAYFGVTAVDISLPALSIARKGIYHKRTLAMATDQELKRYFELDEQNNYRILDTIKKRVCFSQLNILQLQKKPIQPMDIIFCQNVLIYFRRWRRKEIVKQLLKHLKPGGLLIVGLSELTGCQHNELQSLHMGDVQAYVKTPKNSGVYQ